MTSQTYPGADTKTQWFQDNFPGAVMDANCGVIHTTESLGWPGYDNGATAPNITGKPNIPERRIYWRQHFPVDRSSRALRNLAGGVETNTLNAFQAELIGTCDPTKRLTWGTKKAGVDYIYWPEAPDWALRELAHPLFWLEANHGIPAATPVKGRWTAYPESYGPGGQRFTNAEWRALKGWCGHQHVPENTHGDPGSLDFPRVLWHVADLKPIAAPVPPQPAPAPAVPAPVQPSEDSMTIIVAPKGSAYHLTGRGLVWLSGGLVSVEGPYTLVNTDAETWGRYRELYP